MIELVLIFLSSLFSSPNSPVVMQAPTGPKLGWEQPADSLTEAISFTYEYFPDGATIGVAVSATCSGAVTPFFCTSSFPVFSPGQHTLTMTATSQQGLESPKSVPLDFVVPGIPAKVRVIP